MKTLQISILCLVLSIGATTALHAQYHESRYYQQQYAIEDVAVSRPYPKYTYEGRYMGTYQRWKRARWYSRSGGEYVYVRGRRGWYRQWKEGRHWWFDWNVYERRVG